MAFGKILTMVKPLCGVCCKKKVVTKVTAVNYMCGCDGRKGRFVVVEENWICDAMLCKGHRERIVWHKL